MYKSYLYLWCLTGFGDGISDPGNQFAWVFQIVNIVILISKETHSIKYSVLNTDVCISLIVCILVWLGVFLYCVQF